MRQKITSQSENVLEENICFGIELNQYDLNLKQVEYTLRFNVDEEISFDHFNTNKDNLYASYDNHFTNRSNSQFKSGVIQL